ncbi:MAG: hypothetical protein WC952_12660 [Desulfobulbaceae bacterium]
MSERLQMQGRLAELRQEAHSLRMKIEAACRTIRGELNTTIREVEDIDIPLASQQMDDLVMAQAELLAVNSKIARLEKELGLG